MTQIKIEVPANDHIALSAMADALSNIAFERKQEAAIAVTGDAAWKQMDKIYAERNENTPKDVVQCEPCAQTVDVELNRLDEELEASIHHENTKHDEAFEEAASAPTEHDDTLDKDGIPHDKRIHSKGATRLADNTWRLRKRPADKTEEEWTAYIDSVKAELKAVQDIPVTPPEAEFTEQQAIDVIGNANDNPMGVVETTLDEALAEHNENLPEGMKQGEPCTQGDVDQLEANLTPPVIDEPATQLEGVTPNGDVAIEPPVTTAGAPVAPVAPPTSLTSPVVEADKPSVTTFQELMLYMTSDAKKRGADNDMIKATLLEVDPALTAIPLIATRADLIPKFVEALEAKLS